MDDRIVTTFQAAASAVGFGLYMNSITFGIGVYFGILAINAAMVRSANKIVNTMEKK
jgi:hypothetical protein